MQSQVPGITGTFADRLRAVMTAQQIGTMRLAALSRVDVRQITRYRGGRVEPRTPFGVPSANAYKLARALGVEIEELVPPRHDDNGAPARTAADVAYEAAGDGIA